jgi:hypothetical protein
LRDLSQDRVQERRHQKRREEEVQRLSQKLNNQNIRSLTIISGNSKCVNISGMLTTRIVEFNFVRADLDFTYNWEAGNPETKNRYDTQRSNFMDRNRNRDTYFDYWDIETIDGFKEHVMCVVDLEKKTPGIHLCVYLLFGVLFLSVIYRYWLDRVSVFARYHFTKQIFV